MIHVVGIKNGHEMSILISTLSSEHIREMPAWCWNSILTYEVAGETFTAETFIYFTQEGYQHAYGQDHKEIKNDSSSRPFWNI